MSTSRFFDTSVRLHNGNVLVAGGISGSGIATNSAEIYDYAANTWTAAGPMGTPRLGAAAVTLPSGKVLIVGGSSATSGTTSLDTGEVYDPGGNAWTSVASTMSSPRGEYPAVAVLPNGTVLIAGGTDSSGTALASADIYNPATNTFAPASPMGSARALLAAAVLPSGKVLVAGGQDAGGAPTATAETYDPATDSWSAVSNSMSDPRTLAGVAPLPNGDVLVAGGLTAGNLNAPSGTAATTDIYDPSSNSFSAGAPMAVSRALFGMIPLADGRVLAAGGVTILARHGASFLGDTEIYDPQSNRWIEAQAFPPAASLTLTLLPNGQALAAGGTSDLQNLRNGLTQAELFTPPTPPDAPVAVSAVPHNHSAYVTFAPAGSDGGFQTMHYTITASSGQTSTTPDGRTFATVTGLTNGRKVTFTVTATNSLGTGPESAPSNAVTPMAPDKAPRIRIFGLAKRLTLSSFLAGVKFSLKPNKPASLQISLLARAKRATIAQAGILATIARAGTLTLASTHKRRSANRRRIVLVPLKSLVGHPRNARVEIVVIAIDKAGNRSTTRRWITIWSPS